MSGKTTSRKVIITTHGESATFVVKVSEDKNSLDFYCNNCNKNSKPIASLLDSDDKFLFFKRTTDGFELKRKEYPSLQKWTYDAGRYCIEPGAFNDQTEITMNNGKIFIFRNDFYQDLNGTNGITIGFWDKKVTRLFIRCYVKNSELLIEFAE